MTSTTAYVSTEHHTTCDRGHRHWGSVGAAGILITYGDFVLLQHRSAHVDQPNTWSTIGGALADGEDAVDGALREAYEEVGDFPRGTVTRLITDDHGGWAYTTVVLEVERPFIPQTGRHAWESDGAKWFHRDRVAGLNLHPHFRASWEEGVL